MGHTADRVSAPTAVFGGYMTIWLIGHCPKVFKAAVAGAAVTDLSDQYTPPLSSTAPGLTFVAHD